MLTKTNVLILLTVATLEYLRSNLHSWEGGDLYTLTQVLTT